MSKRVFNKKSTPEKKKIPDTNEFISYYRTVERVVSHASEYNSDKTRRTVMAPVLTILRLLLKLLRDVSTFK